jgi:ribosomal protein L16/L10AE
VLWLRWRWRVSVIPMQPNAPILPGGQTMTDPAMVTDAFLRAAQQAATKSLTAQGQDCKDFATAALNFAQAVVVLDPQLSQGGTPLEHDLALKGMEGETQARVAAIQGETAVAVEHVRGEHSLRQARETAAAPTPAKHITINRQTGRTTATAQEG